MALKRTQSRQTAADITPKTDPSRGYARHQVWQTLRESGAFLDLRTIALASGLGQPDCRKILRQLEDEGFVTRAGNTYKAKWNGRMP